MSYKVYYKVETYYTYTNEESSTINRTTYSREDTLDDLVNYFKTKGDNTLQLNFIEGTYCKTHRYTTTDSSEDIVTTNDLTIRKAIASTDDTGAITDIVRQVKVNDAVKETVSITTQNGKLVSEIITVEILELDDLNILVEVPNEQNDWGFISNNTNVYNLYDTIIN